VPYINISDSLYKRLLGRAVSFDDSPEDVIFRLLDENGDPGDDLTADRPKSPARAAPGSVLPIKGYWVPILEVLAEAGGSAPSGEVIEALEPRMRDVLTPRDFEPIQSGEIRWRNRARFARLRMKERGLLSETSHRGLWEITRQGYRFLAEASQDGSS
jgi:Mrr restriction endonuclease-like protein